MKRRVVITGLGLVTPLGIGVAENWRALIAGNSGIGPITQFDCSALATRIAGEVKQWDPTVWMDKREAKNTDRFVQFALAAGKLVLEDAQLPSHFPNDLGERTGCYIGVGLGGIITMEQTYQRYQTKGARHGISPYFVPAMLANLAAGHLSMHHNLRGPNMAHVSACASGSHALGEALRAIQYGTCDVMIAGASEASICALGVGGFNAVRALSLRNDAPERASRPFDATRDGFVMAEGAGVVVLEEHDHAQRRGARVYAELVGYAATADAYHITSPAPEGEGAQRCMRLALHDAALPIGAVDYINAHGTSTKTNDATETHAIKTVFGDHARKVAVSSTKSMTGHLLGAAGAVEAAYSALAIFHGVVPPTINYEHPDPDCDLDYVPNHARSFPVRVVLSNSFGFGGTNATLIFKKVEPS